MSNPYTTIPEFKISYKDNIIPELRTQFTTPEHMADAVRKIFDADTIQWVESCVIIAMNTSMVILGCYKVSQGGTLNTALDPRVVAQFALLSNASAIILAHNHPSGNLLASHQDKTITQQIKEGLNLFNIRLIDHLIITSNGYYSFADDGNL